MCGQQLFPHSAHCPEKSLLHHSHPYTKNVVLFVIHFMDEVYMVILHHSLEMIVVNYFNLVGFGLKQIVVVNKIDIWLAPEKRNKLKEKKSAI